MTTKKPGTVKGSTTTKKELEALANTLGKRRGHDITLEFNQDGNEARVCRDGKELSGWSTLTRIKSWLQWSNGQEVTE